MAEDKLRRQIIEEVAASGEEVWYAIRYLDPDADSRKADRLGVFTVLFIVLLLCAVALSLHFRGL